MFFRKIEETIINAIKENPNKIVLVDGARQIGKSYIIRHIGETRYKHYVEINLIKDRETTNRFTDVNSIQEFYLQLSIVSNGKLGNKDDTLVFLDEIQDNPKLLALLKFLNQDGRYTYIASGSMLGIALKKTISIPMGSITQIHMYPMDFEEFLYANNVQKDVIDKMHELFLKKESVPLSVHKSFLRLFKYYLLSGGLPDAVSAFVLDQSVPKTRQIQLETLEYYSNDASQYDTDNKLNIQGVYKTIPSNMENKKKRVFFKDIENKKGKYFADYKDEFDYLVSSGIAIDVKAVPTPVFPLVQGLEKNLIKLYLNDPGILTAVLYGNNINAILDDKLCVNLGSVYESAVASELKAHGFNLYYYDNRKKGEVDFLIDDYDSLSTIPLEIKSGKDYSTHAALDRFMKNDDYHIKKAYVFSNSEKITEEDKIIYYPIYMCMFLKKEEKSNYTIEPIGEIEWE